MIKSSFFSHWKRWLIAVCLLTGFHAAWSAPPVISTSSGSPLQTGMIDAAVSFDEVPEIQTFDVRSVAPNTGDTGTTQAITISGIGFTAESSFNFGQGITVLDVQIVSATSATATLNIAASAVRGPRDVNGTEAPGGLNATLTAGYTVESPIVQPFAVLSLTQNTGQAGTSHSLIISGFGFTTQTIFDFGPGITVRDVQFIRNSAARATLDIAASAASGPRDVKATEEPGGRTATMTAGYTVEVPVMQPFDVQSTAPNTGQAGTTQAITISGTGFTTQTIFDFGPGITVRDVQIASATSATATLDVAASAARGSRDVNGTEAPGGRNATLTDGFAVTEASYVVTPQVVGDGTVNPSIAQTVSPGGVASFTATAATGSRVASVSGCGATLAGVTITTAAVTGDCTVVVNFEPVTLVPTTTSVSASPDPVLVDQQATMTVVVQASGAAPSPTGQVTIQGGGQSCVAALAPNSPTSSSGTCTLNFSAAGPVAITAAYPGDAVAGLGASSGNTNLTVQASVLPIATITNVSATPDPVQVGQEATAAVVVRAPGATLSPAGQVTIQGGGQSCVATLAPESPTSSAGTCNLRFSSAGPVVLTASYPGDAATGLTASSGTDSLTVQARDPAASVVPVPTLQQFALFLLSMLVAGLGVTRLQARRRSLHANT